MVMTTTAFLVVTNSGAAIGIAGALQKVWQGLFGAPAALFQGANQATEASLATAQSILGWAVPLAIITAVVAVALTILSAIYNVKFNNYMDEEFGS
jgi:hypothetical protein